MVEKAETRVTSGVTLVELGKEYPDLVVLGGDLNKSTNANKFGAEFPDRFFDFGPAEQNIVSVAAGMAASGKIPVVSTFAVFSTSRPYDQLRVGVSQPRLNVKIVATHSGIITGEDGISAHSIEDVAINVCAARLYRDRACGCRRNGQIDKSHRSDRRTLLRSPRTPCDGRDSSGRLRVCAGQS